MCRKLHGLAWAFLAFPMAISHLRPWSASVTLRKLSALQNRHCIFVHAVSNSISFARLPRTWPWSLMYSHPALKTSGRLEWTGSGLVRASQLFFSWRHQEQTFKNTHIITTHLSKCARGNEAEAKGNYSMATLNELGKNVFNYSTFNY